MLEYWPPSLDVLMCRRTFYSSSRMATESTTDWFGRIAKIVTGCEFANFAEIMLIDKFLSGVDVAVYKEIVKENSFDAQKSLVIALTCESMPENLNEQYPKCNAFLKIEIEEPDETNNPNWFSNDDRFAAEDNAHLEEDSLHSAIDKKVSMNATETVKKPPVKRNRNKNGTKKKPSTRQKRDDFVIDEQKRFVCRQCDKPYATRKSFRRHYLLHTDSCLPCPKCGTLFPTNPTLRRHMLQHEFDGITQLECYICRVNFREMNGLRVHLGRTHKANAHENQCNHCDKTFTTNIAFELHAKMHIGEEKWYICEFCGKNFERRTNWKRHLLVHANVRNYTCDQCGKGFTRKDRLSMHLLVHTGERNIACRFCPKKFRIRKTMTDHERIHTGERPFPCKICKKAFSRRENLMRHNRVHAQIKPFPCQMCEKKFATSYHLQRHLPVHTGQKPYACDLCTNRYTQLGSLTTHKLKAHPPAAVIS